MEFKRCTVAGKLFEAAADEENVDTLPIIQVLYIMFYVYCNFVVSFRINGIIL